MENWEKKVLEAAFGDKADKRLLRLYERHRKLDERVSQFEGRLYLTPQEAHELKKLKFLRLHERDKLRREVLGGEGEMSFTGAPVN